jgi:hypothetical protein
MSILVYIKKIYVPETKSKRDKHKFKYYKGGPIRILVTGAIVYRYASAFTVSPERCVQYKCNNVQKFSDTLNRFHFSSSVVSGSARKLCTTENSVQC